MPVGRKFGVMVVVEDRQPVPGRHLPRRGGLPGWPAPGTGRVRRCHGRRPPPRLHRQRPVLRPGAQGTARLGRRRGRPARADHPHHRRTGGTVRRRPPAPAAGGALRRATGFHHRSRHLRGAEGPCAKDQDHQRRAHPRGTGEAVLPAARVARTGVAARRAACSNRSCRRSPPPSPASNRPIIHPEGTVFNHLRADAAASAARRRPRPAVGRPAARCRQARDGIRATRRPAASTSTATRRSARTWPKRSWSACGSPANRSRRSPKPCATTCSSRTPSRCASPPCAACSCAQPSPSNWNCTGSIASVPTAGWMSMTILVAQARELEQQPQIRPPLLTGDDLIALGMKPGPALGALLAEIARKAIAGRTQDQGPGKAVGQSAAQSTSRGSVLRAVAPGKTHGTRQETHRREGSDFN